MSRQINFKEIDWEAYDAQPQVSETELLIAHTALLFCTGAWGLLGVGLSLRWVIWCPEWSDSWPWFLAGMAAFGMAIISGKASGTSCRGALQLRRKTRKLEEDHEA